MFVTAYDEHAVKAFELNAVDYLLKPVSPERLAETVTRLHERLDRVDQRATAVDPAASVPRRRSSRRTHPGFLERIPVRRRDEFTLVPVKQLATLIAAGRAGAPDDDQGRDATRSPID